MKTLRQQRKEKELLKSKAILFTSWNNFFKFEDGKFFSFGKGSGDAGGVWFNCREEETERLREAILSGDFEVQTQIYRGGRKYKLPSEWVKE